MSQIEEVRAELLPVVKTALEDYFDSMRGANRFHPVKVRQTNESIIINSRGGTYTLALRRKIERRT